MVAPVSSFTFNSSKSLYQYGNKYSFRLALEVQFTLVYIMQFILQNQQGRYQKKSGVTYLADQGPLAHFPWEIAALSSSYELTSTILLQEKTFL